MKWAQLEQPQAEAERKKMSKDEEIRNVNIRRKNLLYLTQRYLADNGFGTAAEALRTEARLADEWELCDNIDLDAIYLEYASYYHLKFGKYPRVLRKAKQPQVKVEVAKRKQSKPSGKAETPVAEAAAGAGLTVSVKRIETGEEVAAANGERPSEQLVRLQEVEHDPRAGCAGDALLNSQEWQQLAEIVRATIMREELQLCWGDMYGNAAAMELVKEAVLAPLLYPKLFANGLQPWRSLLLHGPPGSGKTQLARILYAETRVHRVTFFSVSSSVIISKWRGDSEKMLRILFQLAHRHAPSIIFFDEIEGLTSKRDRPGDHESSKRFKNELLQLLDGIEQPAAGSVFVLASTNLPWDIDEAFLRRFEKKLVVQLPNALERARLIAKLLPIIVSVTKEKMESLVRLTEHFTGDELRLACKELAMQAVRRVTKGKDACPVVRVEQAFEQIKPLSVKLLGRHLQWQQEHGS